MGGYAWYKEEELIAIWFASIGINPGVIAMLLEGRGYIRTEKSVRQKIKEIRELNNLGPSSSALRLDLVDTWIELTSQQQNIDIHDLLRPNPKDQEIINQVRDNGYCV